MDAERRLTAAVVTMAGVERRTVDVPEALRDAQVGTVEGSTARLFLERERLTHRTYGSVAAALKALEAEEVEMIAAASPGLDWPIEETGELDAVVVEDTGLDPHYVAFALAPGSELRKPLNAALLRRLSGESGWNLIRRYLPAG